MDRLEGVALELTRRGHVQISTSSLAFSSFSISTSVFAG
jgi:hypothetical protein